MRDAAGFVVNKIEARARKTNLANSSPAMLPQGYAAMSVEFDTDCVPEFLSILEQELKCQLTPGAAEQLALSANQLKRGQKRFHIISLTSLEGVSGQLGFGLFAEDEDAVVLEVHFEAGLRSAIDAALARFGDQQ